MLRYPTLQKEISERVLQSATLSYARYKQAISAHKRTLFLTEHTMVFVLHGHKMLHLHDATVTVHPSSLMLFKRGIYVMSEFVPDGLNYEALLLFFTESMLKNFMLQYKLQPATTVKDSPSYLVIETNELLDSFKDQYLHLFGKHPDNMEAILQLKLQELFLLLISGEHKKEVLSFFQGITHAQPADISYIINTHLFQPLTISDLAKLSGRSLASFKRDFQQQYQCAPKKWINEQRLAHAHMLLQNSSKNVSEIAMECGFENISHFIRIFKQEYGTTPNTLRTKNAIL
ncbi:AraC-type DNA-binding protein [Chitinophaga sp. CF118]|uniref:helix-turn-helix transcriptional regulator n=1 Tax=Chitinophaga sp. CF118 TaxID=1884367 RepID=UPI0008E36558|nr:AraC family transcriptional regulator [Chitinophaga sp. CF118]SFD10446.1 AraC-type DNA-binding protein [Chitinophaga sp. CF118]